MEAQGQWGCKVQHPETSGPSLLSQISTAMHRGELTSVCTMAGRCVRKVFTIWNMSTTPS